MPRIARGSLGGVLVHVINRGNGRRPVFHDEDDYGGFVELLGEARKRTAVPLAGLSLVTNQLKSSLSPLSLYPPPFILPWVRRFAATHRLDSTLRPRGRPRRQPEK